MGAFGIEKLGSTSELLCAAMSEGCDDCGGNGSYNREAQAARAQTLYETSENVTGGTGAYMLPATNAAAGGVLMEKVGEASIATRLLVLIERRLARPSF
ncbi:hypothetical protein MRX96_052660 [Rhipicephalus microplus]